MKRSDPLFYLSLIRTNNVLWCASSPFFNFRRGLIEWVISIDLRLESLFKVAGKVGENNEFAIESWNSHCFYSSRYWRRFRYWENDSHWLRPERCQSLHRCTKREPTQRSALLRVTLCSKVEFLVLLSLSLTSTKSQVDPGPTILLPTSECVIITEWLY